MSQASKIFVPCRGLGYVSNHIPLQVRYIKSRKENLIVTCVGKSFHTYGISHFGLLSVSGLHPEDIECMGSDAYHIYTACKNVIYAWRRGTELKHQYIGHTFPVKFILPFGAHLISIDEGGFLKLFDIKNESLQLELEFSNKTFEVSALMHPSTYINKILMGSKQGSMQLWNINTAKLIYTFKGWQDAITCLEQAPAIDVIAVGLQSGKIILHNLKYDETIMEFMQDWGMVTTISFRTDGNSIMATGSTKGHIVFWNLEERRVSSQLLAAHDKPVTGMMCLPNEPLMLTSSPDNTLKLWIFDMTDGGARLLRIREGHAAPPTHIRYHGANGHNILSSGEDSSLRIFSTQNEQMNKSLGKASYNRKISKKRGRMVEDPLIMPPIIEFTSEITRDKEWDSIAAIHSGIPMVTTWSYDKIRMGNLKLLPERLQNKNKDLNVDVSATCICLTHCGNFVIVGYSTGYVDRFNMQSGIWRGNYGNPKAHSVAIRGVASDALNQITVTGCSEGVVKFWFFKTKEKPIKCINLDESIDFMRSHHESSMIAVALVDFSIHIIDFDTKSVIRKFSGHSAQITDCTFSPDSRWLVSSSMDCSIRTWNIPSAQLIDQFRTPTACTSLNMAPTGEALATSHVNYLGIFLWSNKTLYNNVTLKAISADDEPRLIALPEVIRDSIQEEVMEDENLDEFQSPEQISNELVTISGLATSRWQNLLNIDIIRKRNKPKEPPKTPKAAPFFLPTIPSLNFQFDLNNEETSEDGSKILMPQIVTRLSDFGKLLDSTRETNDYQPVIDKLKTLGPTMIEFELKSLEPETGGSVEVMLQFFKCVEFMLKSNQNFELAQSYLAVFLKAHGTTIAKHEVLCNYLPNIQSCLSVGWNRIQEKLLYNICVVESKKTL